jgi:NAD(P)-dependent dehydrogenase (short-subunit alcohol dehydrogenase family)
MSRNNIAVVTGASSGIGLEAAKTLATMGWRIIALGRDPGRCAEAEAVIRAAARGGEVDFLRCDLAVMADVGGAAARIVEMTEHLDVLLNCAGGTSRQRSITVEGNEAVFAGNYLGHFLLTNRLLPILRRTAKLRAKGQVRVVNVSSSAHEASAGLDWNDLQSIEGFEVDKAYANSKLSNLLHTRSLAQSLQSDGIVAHCMHPGIVATNFVSHGNDAMAQVFADYADITVSAEQGADTLIWLATAEEPGLASGGYFHRRKSAPVAPAAQDDDAVRRLRALSETLTAHVA